WPCCRGRNGLGAAQPSPLHCGVAVLDLDRNISLLPERFAQWFARRGWSPRGHQLELLAKAQADRSVLLIAPTGGGKTLAGFLPTLVELSGDSRQARRAPSPLAGEGWRGGASRRLISIGRDVRREGGLHTLY